MFIPLKMVLIGIDPCPFVEHFPFPIGVSGVISASRCRSRCSRRLRRAVLFLLLTHAEVAHAVYDVPKEPLNETQTETLNETLNETLKKPYIKKP